MDADGVKKSEALLLRPPNTRALMKRLYEDSPLPDDWLEIGESMTRPGLLRAETQQLAHSMMNKPQEIIQSYKPSRSKPSAVRIPSPNAAITAKAESIQSKGQRDLTKAYDPGSSEYRVYAFLDCDNRRSGRQMQFAPPVLEAVPIYRAIGTPSRKKAFTAALQYIDENKEKWETQPSNLTPEKFAQEHQVEMYWHGVGAKKRVKLEKVELKHMKEKSLNVLHPEDEWQATLVLAFVLWSMVRASNRFSTLSSSEQRREFETAFAKYPWPLPEWDQMQLKDGKFPAPKFEHPYDKMPELEKYNRAFSLLHLTATFAMNKAEGSSHYGKGRRKQFVFHVLEAFRDAPYRTADFAPRWMKRKPVLLQPAAPVEPIAEKDPREIKYRYGNVREHRRLDFANQAEQDYHFEQLEDNRLPSKGMDLDPVLDPRDAPSESVWRDRWREVLGLAEMRANLFQIVIRDLADPEDLYGSLVYCPREDPEVTWQEVRHFVANKACKVEFRILLEFPKDPAEFTGLEHDGIGDPALDAFLKQRSDYVK